jgi:Bacterial membrane protein YfhO
MIEPALHPPQHPDAPPERAAFFATTAGAALWLTAVLSLAYIPVFFGRIAFLRDVLHWTYPARWFVRESLLRGDLPLWNPDQGLGFSVLANPLYGLFYPPNWLYLVTPRALVASMVTWQAFAHLLWGSLGILVLARRLRLPAAAAGIAGVAWGLSGYTTAVWTAGLLLSAGAWLPWVAVGFVGLARQAARGEGRWPRAVARAAAPLAMAILLGEVFAAVIAALFGVALAAITMHVDGLAARAPGPAWRPVAAATCVAMALAAGIGAVVVLPAGRVAAATERGQALSRQLAEVCSLHPLRLIEFVAPGSMGYPFAGYVAAPWIGDERLGGLPLLYSVYLGATVVTLAMASLGRRRRLPGLLGLTAVVALLVSLGRHTPIHQWLRTVVRPLAYMRYPEKYTVVVVALCALLAGAGAARVLAGRPAPWRRMTVGLGVLLALALAAPALFPRPWAPYVAWGAIKGALGVALVLVVQGLTAHRRGGALSRRMAPALLVAVVSGDLALAAFPYLDFAPRQLATTVPAAAQAVVLDHRARSDTLAAPRVYRADRTETNLRRFAQARSPVEAERHSLQTLIPNVVTTFGIATLPGYDAAIPALLPHLWLAGQKTGQSVLRLLGIGYAILPIDDPGDGVEHRTGIEPLLTPVPGARLYRVPDALPRVYLAGSADVLADDAALPRLFEPEVVAGGRVLLAPGGQPLAGEPRRAGSCALVSFANTRIVARCRAERPAVAVFIEQHDLGWRAEVDGAAVALLRANLLMRAVPLPAGEHTVRLTYTPPGLVAGAMLSVTSVLLLAALACLPFPRRRRA